MYETWVPACAGTTLESTCTQDVVPAQAGKLKTSEFENTDVDRLTEDDIMTPTTLQSYIAGRWHGQSANQPLHSALDNQLIFHTHAEEIDFDEAVDLRAASTACPQLMQLDFQQRAAAPEGAGACTSWSARKSCTRSRT